jgi:UDP-N-acetylglucosamine:LPS N-acetylglucosamine transferase
MLRQMVLCCAVQEAAYHSVPVISIPLSLGQEEISQFAVDQGRGIVVRKESLMAGHSQPLLNALRDIVMHNSAYTKQVRLVINSWQQCLATGFVMLS